MEKVEEFDVVVIGAGIHGIAFARFYLETHPNARLVILDAQHSVGGSWCKERVYEESFTQSTTLLTAFCDTPLTLPNSAPTANGTFPDRYVASYLEHYVRSHIYSGSSLRDRIRLGHRVVEVDKFGGQWHVLAEEGAIVGGRAVREHILAASRLVIATGRQAEPVIPQLLNSEQYRGLVVHSRDFAAFLGELGRAADESNSNAGANAGAANAGGVRNSAVSCGGEYQHIVVLGGGKVASNMVYACAKRGCSVTWVIRKSGEGPCIFRLPQDDCSVGTATPGGTEGSTAAAVTHKSNRAKDGYANAAERESSRRAQALSPSATTPRLHWSRLVHGTAWGRRKIGRKIALEHQEMRKSADYRARPGALEGFENLNFEGSSWWMTAPCGQQQHDDFWPLISKQVRIYRAEVDHMTSDSLILDDGTEVRADAVLCGTGFLPSYGGSSGMVRGDHHRYHHPRNHEPGQHHHHSHSHSTSSFSSTASSSTFSSFLSPKLAASLGLPHAPQLDTPSELADWQRLLARADDKVLRRYPMLARPPPHLSRVPSVPVVRDSLDHAGAGTDTIDSAPVSTPSSSAFPSSPSTPYTSQHPNSYKHVSTPTAALTSSQDTSSCVPAMAPLTPLRLYHSIAPLPAASEEAGLKSRTIVFLGLVAVHEPWRVAEAQAAWATGWLDGTVECPSVENARRKVAYASALSRRRYPSRGALGDARFWEGTGYSDMLVREVGLGKSWRWSRWWTGRGGEGEKRDKEQIGEKDAAGRGEIEREGKRTENGEQMGQVRGAKKRTWDWNWLTGWWLDPRSAADFDGLAAEYRRKFG